MTHHHHDTRETVVERERPVVYERVSPFGVIAGILAAAAIVVAVWFLFFTDESTRDAVIPDDVDVTVDVNDGSGQG